MSLYSSLVVAHPYTNVCQGPFAIAASSGTRGQHGYSERDFSFIIPLVQDDPNFVPNRLDDEVDAMVVDGLKEAYDARRSKKLLEDGRPTNAAISKMRHPTR